MFANNVWKYIMGKKRKFILKAGNFDITFNNGVVIDIKERF